MHIFLLNRIVLNERNADKAAKKLNRLFESKDL